MFDPNWRLILDALSLLALVATARIALMAFRLQQSTNRTLEKDKVLSRLSYLEDRDAGSPTREDFNDMSGRIGAVERDVSAINASLGGIQRSIGAVQHGVDVITQHLLDQVKKESS